MTPERFRELALGLPEASEGRGGPSSGFRIGNNVFATLFSDEKWAVIRMSATLQAELTGSESNAFETCSGAWGRNGATVVWLEKAPDRSIERALIDAWRKHAPESLQE